MKLAHTMIRVTDLDATLTFYTDFLGLREVRRSAIGDEATLVFLADESESYYIELTYNHDGREYELGSQFGHLAFTVDDLDAVIDEVKRRDWWFRLSKPGQLALHLRERPQRIRHRDLAGQVSLGGSVLTRARPGESACRGDR